MGNLNLAGTLHRSRLGSVWLRAFYTEIQMGLLHRTRFVGLGFVRQGPNLWRIVDIHEGDNQCRTVGPLYKTKAALLFDLGRYAKEAWGYEDQASPYLYQRASDAYPEGADTVLRENCGPIPDAKRFQSGTGYGFEKPTSIHGWQWSPTFGRWSALVTFADGWNGFTWPEPECSELLAA
jgi:hypothetical protein